MDARTGVWVGTFHALAHRLLRLHAREAGLPPTFQILDAGDQLALIKRLLKGRGIPETALSARELAAFIHRHKERGERPGDVEQNSARIAELVALWQAYEEQCAREGVVDFAELLLRSLELLRRNALLRERYRRRFEHILVDEFQDTNPLQYAWLRELAFDPATGEAGAWLFCVGDDDQSIYGFRGAMSALMQRFRNEYAVSALVRLERNYRSVGNVLAAANAVIANNAGRLGKTLWTDAGEGDPVRCFEASDDAAEARFVVAEIEALVRDGWSLEDIAILYRANALSRLFEHHLLAAGIPYRVYGGMRFFDRAEVKHALAYLRLLVLPEDEGALLRVINVPARGIGAKTIEALMAARAESGLGWEAVAAQLSGRAGTAVREFAALIARLRAETAALALPEAIAHVIQASGLKAYYHSDGSSTERQERLENLDALIDAGADFVAELARDGVLAQGHEMIALFLQHASLESAEVQAQTDRAAVHLMTVHAAKGLEFDAVFVVGLEDGVFPHDNALVDDEGGGLEEERRLMYVAITRAKKRLYLTCAGSRHWHGQTQYRPRSRFLDELPAEATLWLSPAPQPVPWAEPKADVPTRLPAGAATSSLRASVIAGPWRSGMRVRHPVFGEGVILQLEGSGAQQQASVRFGPSVGVKRLLLSVAKLTAL